MRFRPTDAFPQEFLVIRSCMLQIEKTQRALFSSFYNLSSALSLYRIYALLCSSSLLWGPLWDRASPITLQYPNECKFGEFEIIEF